MFNCSIRKSFATLHSKICIVGSGAGGVALMGKLASDSRISNSHITVVDSTQFHYYKPGWTMVSSGLMPFSKVRVPMHEVIPGGVKWVQNHVRSVNPKENTLYLTNGDQIIYEQLVISSGLQFNWSAIKGAKEALKDQNRPVTSIYYYPELEKVLRKRKKKIIKKAIFTQAPDPVTCAGAAQKILYTTSNYWEKNNRQIESHFYLPGDSIFRVPFYSRALQTVADSYGIQTHYKRILSEITEDNEAIFVDGERNYKETQEFEFLHFVPPMSGRDYLQDSGIVDDKNFVQVDKGTLQNATYPNVWALGDGSNLPTSKTFAALLDQANVLYQNITDYDRTGKAPTAEYGGYSACPVLVGDNKVMLCEFKYNNVISPTFYKDQRVPRRSFYFLKTKVFPFAAYNLTKRGLWNGRKSLLDFKDSDYTQFQEENS